MRKESIFIACILILISPAMTSAATQTNLLFSDSDTLDAGYFVRYRDSITHSGSTVRVELSINGICGFLCLYSRCV